MTHHEIVRSALGDEQVAAQVPLGGEDELYVTPSRTLVYRSEGLLSDESVDEFPHDAERVEVTEKRRKTKVALEYGLDGEQSFAVPENRVEDALHPVLAGVLNAAGVTEPGETVKQTYRFSELTLVVTSARLIKHIGAAVWDGEFEEVHYDDVTGLEFEDGSVATQIVIEANGRLERIKAPNEYARDVRERLERALFAYHDAGSREEFEAAVAGDDADAPAEDDGAVAEDENVSFGGGVEPLEASPATAETDDAGETAEDGGTSEGAVADDGGANAVAAAAESIAETPDELADPTASADDAADEAVAERLDALTETVERQNDLLAKQRETLERLIDELSRGR